MDLPGDARDAVAAINSDEHFTQWYVPTTNAVRLLNHLEYKVSQFNQHIREGTTRERSRRESHDQGDRADTPGASNLSGWLSGDAG